MKRILVFMITISVLLGLCACGGNGYIPTQAAHEYGCYESHTGRFVAGTGEELVKVLTDSLVELKN